MPHTFFLCKHIRRVWEKSTCLAMENIVLSCCWNDSMNVSLRFLKTMQQYWQLGKRDHVISGTGWILPRLFFKLFLGFKWQWCVNYNTQYCLDISKLSDRWVNFSEVFVEWLSVARQIISNCVSFLTKIILESHILRVFKLPWTA